MGALWRLLTEELLESHMEGGGEGEGEERRGGASSQAFAKRVLGRTLSKQNILPGRTLSSGSTDHV